MDSIRIFKKSMKFNKNKLFKFIQNNLILMKLKFLLIKTKFSDSKNKIQRI